MKQYFESLDCVITHTCSYLMQTYRNELIGPPAWAARVFKYVYGPNA